MIITSSMLNSILRFHKFRFSRRKLYLCVDKGPEYEQAILETVLAASVL